jgi:CRISPR/Cas system-associated exonuclease Cas4 (RecB family)
MLATTGEISFHLASTWLDVPYLEAGFIRFLDKVLALLELPEPPPASEKCTYCQYRQRAREHGM